MPYTLILCSDMCQLFLNKIGGKRFLISYLKKTKDQALAKWFLLKAGLVEKNTLYCVVLQNGYFPLPLVRGMGGFFFHPQENLVEVLKVKLTKIWDPSYRQRFFSLICPGVCQLQFGFFYLALVSRAFCSWVSVPISYDSLYVPVHLQFGGSGLPCDLKSLIEEKLLGCSDDLQSLYIPDWNLEVLLCATLIQEILHHCFFKYIPPLLFSSPSGLLIQMLTPLLLYFFLCLFEETLNLSLITSFIECFTSVIMHLISDNDVEMLHNYSFLFPGSFITLEPIYYAF